MFKKKKPLYDPFASDLFYFGEAEADADTTETYIGVGGEIVDVLNSTNYLGTAAGDIFQFNEADNVRIAAGAGYDIVIGTNLSNSTVKLGAGGDICFLEGGDNLTIDLGNDTDGDIVILGTATNVKLLNYDPDTDVII